MYIHATICQKRVCIEQFIYKNAVLSCSPRDKRTSHQTRRTSKLHPLNCLSPKNNILKHTDVIVRNVSTLACETCGRFLARKMKKEYLNSRRPFRHAGETKARSQSRGRKISLAEFREESSRNSTWAGLHPRPACCFNAPLSFDPLRAIPFPRQRAREDNGCLHTFFPECARLSLHGAPSARTMKINIHFHSKHRVGHIAVSSGRRSSDDVARLLPLAEGRHPLRRPHIRRVRFFFDLRRAHPAI